MPNRITTWIIVAMVAGVVSGATTHVAIGGSPTARADVAGHFYLLADMFLHLIKMVIAPLVFSTLVLGITHMGDGAALGRIGGRAIGWFRTVSLISIGLGRLVVNLLGPGEGLNLTRHASAAGVDGGALNLRDFVLHVVPT